MSNQHYLFYGADVVALRQKVKEWRGRFAEKADADLDMSEHHAPLNVAKLVESLHIQPLLGPKRLIVIYGASGEPTDEQERIVRALQIASDKTVTLFIEENESGLASVIGKYVGEHGKVSYFPALDQPKLRLRIAKLLREADINIQPDALTALSTRLLGPGVNFEGEINKIKLLGQDTVTLAMVDQLVPAALEFRAFALGEAVLSGDSKRAWQIIVTEIENGTEPMKLLGQLIGQTRRLIAMRELQDQKKSPATSEYFRAQKPYTVTMAEKQAKRFSLLQLCKYYQQLALSDLRIKTGDDPLNVLALLTKIT